MKVLKFLISAVVTIGLVVTLNSSLTFGDLPIPPVGKFLDPFHGFWQNAETSVPDLPAELEFAGLSSDVEIIFDTLMIPHIFAENDEDLYFAQGYIHAYHRLWQMEFQIYYAEGRLSEIIGENTLATDRETRRKGMVLGAERFLERSIKDPEIKAYLESYTAGINAYISSLEYDTYPIEYKILNYAPEEWTPIKSALLLKNMSNTLNMDEQDLKNTNALAILGPEMFNFLYPDHLLKSDNIVDNPGSWGFEPVTVDQDSGLIKSLIQIPAADPQPEENVGSNNWAVHGSRTKSGYPLLASDPHLELSLPSIWYTAHLNSPSVNTMGATLLGSPTVIIGFNDSIAWAETNAQRDLVDWFQIEFKDESRSQYKLDGQWVDTRFQIEEIKIKGQESFYDTVLYTHWGPVLYDKNFGPDNGKKDFAFRWIAHDASEEFTTLIKLNRASNFVEYRDALRHWSAPAQNFAFASASNDIGITVQGRYPVRPLGVGKFLFDGTETRNGWLQYIPFEHNVFIKNPERGFISSANQHPVDTTYPYYVYARSFEVFRNRRINDVLENLNDASPQDMMNLQQDNFNTMASDALPVMLSQLQKNDLTESERSVLEVISSWDYFNNADSRGATVFEAWYDFLHPMIWDEIRNATVAMPYPAGYRTVELMKNHPDLVYFDMVSTEEQETLSDVITLAFKRAVESLLDEDGIKEWADYKNTVIQHLARIPQFSSYVRNGGNHNIVNATSESNGGSWRMIVSLEPGNIEAWGVYPGGQSGNPGSPYYDDWVGVWETGNYNKLQFEANREAYESNKLTSLVLKAEEE